MNFIKRLITLACAFLLYISAYGQSSAQPNISDFQKITEVLPPSPNAASLGRYGGVDIGLSSGSANMSIPIYEYRSRNIKLPLSIDYTTTGFKIDEIASRAGTGWSLNVGGVITRTVFGAVDERTTRLAPPANFPTPTRTLVSFLDYVANSSSSISSGVDAEPDVFNFNFNGNTGRFILDSTLHPILLTHSGLKIEGLASGDWNFKITTADGVQYLFGGNATERTSKTTTGAGCSVGKLYDQYTPTAWYLNRIIHPNNDTITLFYSAITSNYATSKSEAIYQRDTRESYTQTCSDDISNIVSAPYISNTNCTNLLQTNGVILKEISSANAGKIAFSYITRSDYNDSLLSSISIYQPAQTIPYKVFSFAYTTSNTRPFLSSMVEKSSDGAMTNTHKFSYNNISSIPGRLSYAQDHWGYYNGMGNVTLIPRPSSQTFVQYLPSATANREPDPTYCMMGLLSGIIYPTGGKDSIMYEGNKVYKEVTLPQPSVNIGGNVTIMSIGIADTVYSSLAVVETTQDVILSGYLQPYNTSTVGYPEPTGTLRTILYDETQKNVVYFRNVSVGESFQQTVTLYSGRTYRVKIFAAGQNITGGGGFNYKSGTVSKQYMNVITGGVRVAKVYTQDNLTNMSSVKVYKYGRPEDSSISSASLVYEPFYETFLKAYVVCQRYYDQIPVCDVKVFNYFSMFSNSLKNVYVYNGAPVTYKNVVEYFGENGENGFSEHEFLVAPDKPAETLMGEFIQEAPYSNYSLKNGKEIYRGTYKKKGNNFLPVRKIFTHYKEDGRASADIKAYVANKKYQYACNETTIPSSGEMAAYDLTRYSLFKKWLYADTIKTLNYDANGVNYLEDTEIYEYGNPEHTLPTKIQTLTSDNRIKTINNYYPFDITLSGNPETARQALISRHIISPLLKQEIKNANITTFTLRTDYGVFPNQLVLPQSKYITIGSGIAEKQFQAYSYNNSGGILEYSRSNDVHEVVLWGYGDLYTVAKITGASSYGAASSLVSQAILQNPVSDLQLRSELNKIRNSLTSALIETYTYKPLIGVTTATDPSSKTIFYEYDVLGRLKLIKDEDGKILKQFDYQYQIPVTQ